MHSNAYISIIYVSIDILTDFPSALGTLDKNTKQKEPLP